MFAALWLLFAVGNASILLGLGAKPEKGRSMVPFIGGLAGAMACLASPYPLLGWAWVPLLLDVGSVPMLGLLAWHLLKPKKGGSGPEAGE